MSGYAAFHIYCPEIGINEYRSMLISAGAGQPMREFGFLEMYCTVPDCDCRRVIFRVLAMERPRQVAATLGYGWESPEFYVKWMDGDTLAERMAGLSIEILGPQSNLSEMLLGACREFLISDPKYVERLKRHYALFKKAIAAEAGEDRSAPETPRQPRHKKLRWKH